MVTTGAIPGHGGVDIWVRRSVADVRVEEVHLVEEFPAWPLFHLIFNHDGLPVPYVHVSQRTPSLLTHPPRSRTANIIGDIRPSLNALTAVFVVLVVNVVQMWVLLHLGY